MCYDFLLFIHILGDVPFSKGIHRACFPTQFGKQAFLVYHPIFNALRSPDIATKKNQGRFKQPFFKLRDIPGTAKD